MSHILPVLICKHIYIIVSSSTSRHIWESSSIFIYPCIVFSISIDLSGNNFVYSLEMTWPNCKKLDPPEKILFCYSIYMYILQKVKLSVIFNMCPIWNNKSIIIDFMAYSNSKHTAAYYLANTNITTNYIISTMSCEEMRFGHWCTSGRKTSSYKATKKK